MGQPSSCSVRTSLTVVFCLCGSEVYLASCNSYFYRIMQPKLINLILLKPLTDISKHMNWCIRCPSRSMGAFWAGQWNAPWGVGASLFAAVVHLGGWAGRLAVFAHLACIDRIYQTYMRQRLTRYVSNRPVFILSGLWSTVCGKECAFALTLRSMFIENFFIHLYLLLKCCELLFFFFHF